VSRSAVFKSRPVKTNPSSSRSMDTGNQPVVASAELLTDCS
jgi:hypothetical protein